MYCRLSATSRMMDMAIMTHLMSRRTWRIKPLGIIYVILPIISVNIYIYICSDPSPAVDETNVGNRDDALKKTYRGLVNLKYVILTLNHSYFKHYLFHRRLC